MVFRVENLTLISSAFPATQTEPRILLFTP